MGILAANSPDWVIADLALRSGEMTGVPLPEFFSDEQLRVTIENAGLTAILTDNAIRAKDLVQGRGSIEEVGSLALLRLGEVSSGAAPSDTAVVTFTSGTTGAPKGVCLSEESLLRVAQSLGCAVQTSLSDVHLCVLPLSILLEAVGGVYRSLLAGATVVVPSSAALGLDGSSSFDPEPMLRMLQLSEATTAICVPEMLAGLIAARRGNRDLSLPRLRFVGVGGAHVPAGWIEEAHELGVPAYEGYGLSETASVCALNSPGNFRPGFAGRVLNHCEARVDDQGELWVRGPLALGYLNDGAFEPLRIDRDGFYATGDLAELHGGWLRILGRRKSQLITSFGRNVSPEWIEAELQGLPGVKQVVVIGEARPALEAVVVTAGIAEIDRVVEELSSLNRRLPDYARIAQLHVRTKAFGSDRAEMLPNGRPDRAFIQQQVSQQEDSYGLLH